MPTMKRIKAKGYKGVFYIVGTSPATGEKERIYMIRYRNPSGKLIEEKVGRATVRRTGAEKTGEMTALDASNIRADRMRGRDKSNEERREEIRAAKAATAKRWTFSRLWAEYRTGKPDAKRSATDETNFTLYLAPAFGDKEPREVVPLDVDRLRLTLSKKKATATVKNILELLRRLSNFAENKRLCAPLPFRVTLPRVNNIVTEDLNAAQTERLLKVLRGEIKGEDGNGNAVDLDPDAREMMMLALLSGMRRGEIFRLKWDDVDFQRGVLTLRDPKSGTDERIPMSDAVRELLEGRTRTDSPYVFPGRPVGKGKEKKAAEGPKVDAAKSFRAIRKAAGLPEGFRPMHGLRHAFASHLVSSGVDLYVVQRLLTHKSPAMTMRYSHLGDGVLKRAAELAGRIVEQSTEKAAKAETA